MVVFSRNVAAVIESVRMSDEQTCRNKIVEIAVGMNGRKRRNNGVLGRATSIW